MIDEVAKYSLSLGILFAFLGLIFYGGVGFVIGFFVGAVIGYFASKLPER